MFNGLGNAIYNDNNKTNGGIDIDEEELMKQSHWYCKEGSGLEDKYSGSLPNEVAIKKIQDSMYYYLVRDEAKPASAAADQQQQKETILEQKVEEQKTGDLLVVADEQQEIIEPPQQPAEEKKEKKEGEQKGPNELFTVDETTNGGGDDGIVTTIKYNRLAANKSDLIYFTIHIPDLKCKLLVSRELLMLESKVFEGMLNSEMLESTSNEMTLQPHDEQLVLADQEKSSSEYFKLAMKFIHVGSLGLDETSFMKESKQGSSSNLVSLLAWKDLLGLLRVADEYQIESLTRAISRVVNQFNALTIGLTCLEFSADCKSIILPIVCSVLAFNPACVVSDMVYSGLPLEKADEETVLKYLEDPSLALKEYPLLDTPLAPPELHKLLATPLIAPLAKIIISLPLELFEGILASSHCEFKQDEMAVFISLWMLQDVENRFTDGYRLISQNIDWSCCGDQVLYTLIYYVFIGIGKQMPQFKTICDEAHDRLHMSMFRKSSLVSDEEWQKYMTHLYPERAQTVQSLKKELRCLTLGLDATGKTTILYKLKLDEMVQTIPTIGFNVETIHYKRMEITMWDVGGGDKIRPLWRHYYENTGCVIFVVDSNDRDRIDEAAEEFHKVLQNDELTDCAFLIYANKQDLPNAMNASEVAEKMKLHSLRDKKWFIQSCCATTGEGLYEGLEWMVEASKSKTGTIVSNLVSVGTEKKYSHFGSFKLN